MVTKKAIKDSRSPNLTTILMVEKLLIISLKPLSLAEIKQKLPRKVMHQTLRLILEYLWESGKISYTPRGVLWQTEKKFTTIKSNYRMPNLATILMVEKTLKRSLRAVSIPQLKKILPRQVMHQTLKITLAYLWKSKKIEYTPDGIKVISTGTNLKSRKMRSKKPNAK